MSAQREIVVSGMRPTGRLHLGNYWGALKNWIELSNIYQCYFFVADWHMLTTGYENTFALKHDTREMVIDWIAAGLDPEKCVIFRQSDVPEHAELALLLGMVTPVSILANNPTYKGFLQDMAGIKLQEAIVKTGSKPIIESYPEGGRIIGIEETVKEINQSLQTLGFLGYPVLQAADILIYHGAKVPVGQDQLPHLELSREIARRFNNIFGQVLTEPQPLLAATPKVPGTDGRKMSKSYANAVNLYETEESLKKRVMAAYTDPTRIKATDPGHPEPCAENPPGCSVFALHKLYGAPEFVKRRDAECRAGKIGCVSCKKDLLGELEPAFAAFRKARELYAANPARVEEILAKGAQKARAAAQKTMAEVRRAMNLS